MWHNEGAGHQGHETIIMGPWGGTRVYGIMRGKGTRVYGTMRVRAMRLWYYEREDQ